MKKIFLLFLILPIFCFAKNNKNQFIAKTYSEFINPKPDTTIQDIFVNSSGDNIIVKTKLGKQKYPIESVWGYLPKDGVSKRVYKKHVYEIKQIDTLSIYGRTISMGKRKRQTYFSVGLNGDIYKLNSVELEKVFGKKNEKFLKIYKEELKWYDYYEAFDKKTNSYKIVNIFKKSIQLSQ